MANRRGGAALTRESLERVVTWLEAATKVPLEDFTWCRGFDEVPAAARADSWSWCDQIFTAEASPHEAPGGRCGFHAGRDGGPDLVRHAYRVQDLDLSLLEGRNFVLVEVRFDGAGVLDLPKAER